MTVDDAVAEAREILTGQLYAQARALGVALDVAAVAGLVDRALEASGFRVLAAAFAASDVASSGYAGSYEETPPDLVDADDSWRAARDQLVDYPFLAGLRADEP